jgi:cytochrome b561
MFQTITFYPIFGVPLLMYGGMFTLLLFFFAAYIGNANMKGNHNIPVKWHILIAKTAIVLAILHGLFAILSLF